MILICPACSTRYLMDPALFGVAARRVRCARCQHEWMQEPSPQVSAPLPELPMAPVAEPNPRNLPKIRPRIDTKKMALMAGYGAGGLLVGLLLLLVFFQDNALKIFPALRSAYMVMGLYDGEGPEGLMLQSIRSEQRYDRGARLLYVAGEVRNLTDEPQKMMPLLIEALNETGTAVSRFITYPAPPILEAQQISRFEASFPFPSQPVTEIVVTFTEEPEKPEEATKDE